MRAIPVGPPTFRIEAPRSRREDVLEGARVWGGVTEVSSPPQATIGSVVSSHSAGGVQVQDRTPAENGLGAF